MSGEVQTHAAIVSAPDAAGFLSWDHAGAVAVCVLVLVAVGIGAVLVGRWFAKISGHLIGFLEKQTTTMVKLGDAVGEMREDTKDLKREVVEMVARYHLRVDYLLSCRKQGCPMGKMLSGDEAPPEAPPDAG